MPDQVLRVQSVLTARDHQLLDWLFDHGVLTTGQIAEALFPSLDFAQHRLQRLTGLKVVDRFRPFRAEGGSYPFHYVIDQLGAEVVAAQRDEPIPRPGYAKAIRRRWTASRILQHRLGVNGFFTQLAGHVAHELQRWWPESRCSVPGAFAGPGDRVELITQTLIRPDGHGVWSGVPFFLEYDTGGEPLTELLRKVAGYARFVALGGPAWPVLLWLHSPDREHHLHQRLADLGPLGTPVATAAGVPGVHPATGPWWLHGHPAPLALADLPTGGTQP